MSGESVKSGALGRDVRYHWLFIEKVTCDCVCIDISMCLYRYTIERIWAKGALENKSTQDRSVLSETHESGSELKFPIES